QREFRGDVADGVEAGDVGSHVLVDLDALTARVELHAEIFQAVVRDVGGEPDCLQHTVHRDARCAAGAVGGVAHGHTVGPLDDRLDGGTGDQLYIQSS